MIVDRSEFLNDFRCPIEVYDSDHSIFWRVIYCDGYDFLPTTEYDCPALGNPIHGFKVGGSPQYRVHSRVRFRCDDGYEMVGSEERICTITGEWTGEMPRCMGTKTKLDKVLFVL